jgi:CHAT domain-containing protein/Tfp pilus assembly protein PilF
MANIRAGESYSALGELEKALEHYLRGYSLVQNVGNNLETAQMFITIGGLYNKLGEPKEGLEYANRALAQFRDAKSLLGEANAFIGVAASHFVQGEYRETLDHVTQALALYRKAENRAGEARALDSLGVCYFRLGEPRKALEYFNQALDLGRVEKFPGGGAMTLQNLSRVYCHLGEPQKALECSTQALELSRASGDRMLEAIALKGLALAESLLGKYAEALANVEQAVRLAEFIRANAGGQDHRSSFLADNVGFYEFHIDLLMKMHAADPAAGHDRAALAVSEQARARSLFELLHESHVDIRQGVDRALTARERGLRESLDAKLNDLGGASGAQDSEERKAGARREVARLTDEYRQVQDEIRRRSPRYAALGRPQPLEADEIQQALDGETVLLEYSLGDERSWLWVVGRNSVISYQLPPRAEIETAARKVYESFANRPAKQGSPDSEFDSQAAALSQLLLGAAMSQLGGKRLVIVSQGALAYLPFAALPVPTAGGYRPLIAEHEIVNLPSVSVLSVIRHETAGRRKAAKTVAVLADPVFSGEDARVKAAAAIKHGARGAVSDSAPTSAMKRAVRSVTGSDRTGLQRLLFSREEAEAIASLAPASSVLKALDFLASRETAMSDELGQYGIIHFATHGLLDSSHPELSGLALSLVDEHGRERDGYLRLNEIYNLKLNADLVVLSACQTGLGKDIRGEGLIGLTRGFMYAGAPRVVASLWRVDDAATAELMKRFYRGMLKGGLRPAEALRSAQLEMMSRPAWRSPYFWGGFTLQGEWK